MFPNGFSEKDCEYACKIVYMANEVGLDVAGFGFEERGGGIYFAVNSDGAVIFADYSMKGLYGMVRDFIEG